MSTNTISIHEWLVKSLKIPVDDLHPLTGDASVRSYFRLHSAGQSFVVMVAPRDMPGLDAYQSIGRQLIESGLQAPRVLHQAPQAGFYLINDLGDRHYLDSLNEETADNLYSQAISALLTMQTTLATEALPAYDKAMLVREMELFREWFLGEHANRLLNPDQAQLWRQTLDILADSALAQPRCFVHRDYHSRNLLVTDEKGPGILDFQDAVAGPISYDIVSLLKDCYISWPGARVETWLHRYFDAAQKQPLLAVKLDFPSFQRSFDWMGVQRHLKAIGIFARLHHRDGKSAYLGDIPRTLRYINEVCEVYPELSILRELLQQLQLDAYQP